MGTRPTRARSAAIGTARDSTAGRVQVRALGAPEPENTRVRIIDAAIRLLGEGGYAALSDRTIRRQAEVAAPSLYWHFGDEAGLIAATVRHVQRLDANTVPEEPVDARTTSARIETNLPALIARRRPLAAARALAALLRNPNDDPQVFRVVRARGRPLRTAARSRHRSRSGGSARHG